MEFVMSIVNQVKEELDNLIRLGVTQTAIAKRFGVSQAHMNKLISGERRIDGISIDTLDRAFPGCQLVTGENHVLNTGTINGNITQTTDSISAFKSRLLSQLLQLDLDGDSLVKVMKLVNDAK